MSSNNNHELTSDPPRSAEDVSHLVRNLKVEQRTRRRFRDIKFYATTDTETSGPAPNSEPIHAHPAILVKGSPYFARLLSEHDDLDELVLAGIEKPTLEGLFEYIYSGEMMDVNEATVTLVYYGAKTLELEAVQSHCLEFMENNIRIHNGVEYWMFGELEAHPELVQRSKQFVLNNLNRVSLTYGFLNLENTKVQEIMEAGSSSENYPNEMLLHAAIHWLKHDVPGRSSVIHEILTEIRLETIDSIILKLVFQKDPVVRGIPTCAVLYLQAIESLEEHEEQKEGGLKVQIEQPPLVKQEVEVESHDVNDTDALPENPDPVITSVIKSSFNSADLLLPADVTSDSTIQNKQPSCEPEASVGSTSTADVTSSVMDNNDEFPSSGANNDELPSSGANNDELPSSGANNGEFLSSGANNDELPSSGANNAKVLSSELKSSTKTAPGSSQMECIPPDTNKKDSSAPTSNTSSLLGKRPLLPDTTSLVSLTQLPDRVSLALSSKKKRRLPTSTHSPMPSPTPSDSSVPSSVGSSSFFNASNPTMFYLKGKDSSPRRQLIAYDFKAKLNKVIDDYPFNLNDSCLVYYEGSIYVLGGNSKGSEASASVKIFDLQEGRKTRITTMLKKRSLFNYAILNQCIYALGGCDGQKTINCVEKLPLDKNKDWLIWEQTAGMKRAREQCGSCALDGKIYAVGGWVAGTKVGSPANVSNSVECYDPATDSWTIKSDMPTKRMGLAVVAVDGLLYAIGGGVPGQRQQTYKKYTIVEIFDPVRNSWKLRAPLRKPRIFFSVVVIDGDIYAIGGDSNTDPTVEKFDPAYNEWTMVDHGKYLSSNGNYSSVAFASGC